MIDLVRWLIGSLLASAGLYVIVLNWSVFWKCHVAGREAPSWIPLLGGVMTSVGLFIIPYNFGVLGMISPLLVDWGTVPGIAYSIFVHMFVRQPLDSADS